MHWFFDQVLFGTDVCDYKVANITNQRMGKGWGIYESKTEVQNPRDSENADSLYYSRVILHRLGGMKLPLEVLVHFEDGTEKIEYWDGRSSTHEFVYRSPQKVAWAKIDPEYKIEMDVNYNNNSYTVEPQTTPLRKYAAKFMLLVQHVMLSLFV